MLKSAGGQACAAITDSGATLVPLGVSQASSKASWMGLEVSWLHPGGLWRLGLDVHGYSNKEGLIAVHLISPIC